MGHKEGHSRGQTVLVGVKQRFYSGPCLLKQALSEFFKFFFFFLLVEMIKRKRKTQKVSKVMKKAGKLESNFPTFLVPGII